jgi:hypothetical protein
MKKLFLCIILFLVSCAPLQNVTVDSSTDILDQFSTPLPAPTLAVVTRPIDGDEKEAALNFFYEMKNKLALGEYEHFAEEIRYPITVNVSGTPATFIYVAEFEANFEKIFSKEAVNKLISTDESELTFTPSGVKVADGIFWFDLICMDPSCENAEFMITEINN